MHHPLWFCITSTCELHEPKQDACWEQAAVISQRSCVLLLSCRPSSSGLLLEEKVAGGPIRLSFQAAPHDASPHQTQRARPRRTSLGIFNTAGCEVLIAPFLTRHFHSATLHTVSPSDLNLSLLLLLSSLLSLSPSLCDGTMKRLAGRFSSDIQSGRSRVAVRLMEGRLSQTSSRLFPTCLLFRFRPNKKKNPIWVTVRIMNFRAE